MDEEKKANNQDIGQWPELRALVARLGVPECFEVAGLTLNLVSAGGVVQYVFQRSEPPPQSGEQQVSPAVVARRQGRTMWSSSE